ncbi:Reverse transcriptase (RNA-dependent DNA polymerase) [Legionella busanensis]|uniref:Reverse transcriptase (RNA-dependent DNA polymerase) n=1 Tax=Legionella busanensis TaxID=190655 RepID=A0A378JHX5_9GAMM|nr:RNA-directed DNA polymerase [Legionella busanensis]STX50916.1 Reverse transcriptase (RNA-dependent DNA polymerase) [Legionella busanensis]
MGSKLKQGIIPVLALSASQAKKYFLKAKSYCNFDIPNYINFEPLLREVEKQLKNRKLSDFYNGAKPRDFENVNHKILNNKDGKYSWRPFQLIHPALYVDLVKLITESQNWQLIQARFQKFSSDEHIHCLSIPFRSNLGTSNKSEQVANWWIAVEQKSLELALDFQYIIQTDINECYSSIYTHSIAWAIHGKTDAKSKQKDKALLGNKIDNLLQDMHHGQTNGIPQGSALMDFIAEIVLGYADELLIEKLKSIESQNDFLGEYLILRYRDDYRIFVNSPITGDVIIKYLCEVLSNLSLKLNPGKTSVSYDIITESIKSDKLFWMNSKHYDKNLQKHLLIIHSLSKKFPNSGSLITALKQYYERLFKIKIGLGNVKVLLGITVDIAQKNPRSYPECAAIISCLISNIKYKKQKSELINKIHRKFEMTPNTGHLEIWLQRVSLRFYKEFKYEESICKKVMGKKINIWNCDWLSTKLSRLINEFDIVDQEVLNNLPDIIRANEVELFHTRQDY